MYNSEAYTNEEMLEMQYDEEQDVEVVDLHVVEGDDELPF